MLVQDEGCKLKPYTDTKGKITIGVGRNLTDVGVSGQECMAMLDTDVQRAISAAKPFSFFTPDMNPIRRDVVTMLIFNLGLGTYCTFKEHLAAMYSKNYSLAAQELLDSRWAKEVGERAQRLSQMLVSGLYPTG